MTNGQKSARSIRKITISILRDLARGEPRYSAKELRIIAKRLARTLEIADVLAGDPK